ncbi:MAG: prepilin-type N-terminal cleavage/methylation domain-containing protein [Candidatus Saccharimonadales bacterium]|jgi:prepilin-type N-terminal cleavage/methylation domain-containing protein
MQKNRQSGFTVLEIVVVIIVIAILVTLLVVMGSQ